MPETNLYGKIGCMVQAISLSYWDNDDWQLLLNPKDSHTISITSEAITEINTIASLLLERETVLVTLQGNIVNEVIHSLTGLGNLNIAIKAFIYTANSGSLLQDNIIKTEQNEPANFYIIMSNFSNVGGVIFEIASLLKDLHDISIQDLTTTIIEFRNRLS